MPYIFPRRTLKPQDVLDPLELNEDLQTVKTVSGGGLDLENINGISADGFKSAARPNQEAYYKYHKANNKTYEPSFEDGRPLERGDEGVGHPDFDVDSPDSELFLVPNTNSWTTVSDTEITITTGQSNLWINGWLQYVRNGWLFGPSPIEKDDDSITTTNSFSQLGLHHISNGFFGSRAQFAIRVDGRVIEWTITGKRDIFSRTPFGVKPVVTNKVAASTEESNLPGSRVPDTRAVSPGPEVLPIRLGTIFPVEPGTHKIEIVARRLPTRKGVDQRPEDVIGVHSRELHIIEMPIHAVQSTVSEVSDRETFVFDAEDEVQQGTLGRTVENLADEISDLREGNIRREALFNSHLPSKVVSVKQSTINNQDRIISPHWPGTQLVDVTNDLDGWGWYQLRDVPDNRLTISTEERFQEDDIVILMANIALRRVQVNPGAGMTKPLMVDRFLDSFAAFRFGIRDEATSTGIEDWRLSPYSGPYGPSGNTAYVNSFNWHDLNSGYSAIIDSGINASNPDVDPLFGPNMYENVDIPLFTVLRGSDFSPLETKHYISVFAASMATVEGGARTGPSYSPGIGTILYQPFIEYRRANLIMIHLRK